MLTCCPPRLNALAVLNDCCRAPKMSQIPQIHLFCIVLFGEIEQFGWCHRLLSSLLKNKSQQTSRRPHAANGFGSGPVDLTRTLLVTSVELPPKKAANRTQEIQKT